MKNVLFWCGVKAEDSVRDKYRYGDFSWMEYSKLSWQYWCKKNDVVFLHYDKTSKPDQLKYKINWQRWLDIIPFVESNVPNYNKVLAIDASIMVKWNAPNFFDESENKWCGLIGNENLKWVYESIEGYKPLFNNFNFDYSKHYLAGFVLFNKSHKFVFENLSKFYYENHNTILEYEDKIIKRGRDQPVLNYILQTNNVETNPFPISHGGNHLWRRNLLQNNGDLPLFVKYMNTWIFSGFPDRGETRIKLMKQTWDLVKHNYE